jgi:hypothetical protein
MIFMNLIKFSNFMQGLNSARKRYTENECFSMHILFSIVCLLQEQQLNHRNYSEQEIIMRSFVQATGHDINMHAKIQYLILHRFL